MNLGPVSTADMSRSALDRINRQLTEVQEQSARNQEEFRYLLSYCEEQAQHSGYALEESAYRDIAGKLRELLDGE